jgi:two-component system OmpR family sensor kinase
VRQVVLNLLINACAATPAGGTVRLRAHATESALSIEVDDQGPGLPDDLAKYLVGHSDEAPGTGGGLGLWIVRRLVADEDGEIQVTQENGFSTLIKVTWPFRENLSRSDRAKDSVGMEAVHAE